MSDAVRVKEAVLVTPSEPTPTHVLRLSALDSQLFVRFTFEYLLVYDDPSSDKPATAARLKSALAGALVPYYPLTGRVRKRSDGSGLEVACRAQGALFIEASSDWTVSEFETAPTYGTQRRSFLSFHVDDVLAGEPPLVVQLTWLADGGATLGVGFNHCLLDGAGSGEFLNSFARLALNTSHSELQGKINAFSEQTLSQTDTFKWLKLPPVWSRHLMDPTPFSIQCLNNYNNHTEFKKVSDTCRFVRRLNEEQLVPTSVTFDRKWLADLKKSSESYTTSFEVVAAHVWRSWVMALNLPSKQVVKLLFSMDIRRRVKPSLPGGYYGNAFVLCCAEITVRELTENGLSHATELVRRAKERVDDGFVREVVAAVSSIRWACPDSVGVLIMTQWSRLGLNRVDFGMGQPINVEPVCSDRYCILLPASKCDAAVKVNLAVPTTAVDQYVHLLRCTNST